MKKNTLRLLLFSNCNRNCEGCCNKQFDLSNLPVCNDYTPYNAVMLTGGEPMLYPEIIRVAVTEIRKQNPSAQIILYTAMCNSELDELMQILDGVTVTLHSEHDMESFFSFDGSSKYLNKKSLRLNVFKEVDDIRHEQGLKRIRYMDLWHDWKVKDNITWIENCPLPDNEVFMRFGKPN